MDADEKRIHAVLGDDSARTMQNAERYRAYLVKHLSLPVLATGTEDFPWEEPYVLGGWDQDEYEELKKTNPSYTDTFEIKALAPPNEHEDIVARVRRESDGKEFEIGLSWLSCEDEDSDAYTLLEDYGVWHTNY
jgi:hypothetical protein